MNTLIETNVNSVKILKFNKPNKKNAIDYNMYVKATKALDRAAEDVKITLVIFTGTGDFYSSGNEFPKNNMQFDKDLLLESIRNFIKAIILFPKLLIAIVNGPAIGIAATTLPLCDFVYSSENAYFYTPFTKLGVTAEACSSITFPQLMGERLAREMLMLNYKMDAQEALKCGLVSHVYKPEDLESKAWENIEVLLNLSQTSLLTTKKLLRRQFQQIFIETNDIEIQQIKKLSQSKL